MDKVCDCKNHIWMPILAVLVVAILIVTAFSAGNASSDRVVVTSDSTPNIKTMSVSGSVTKMVTPDKVEIILSVETLDLLATKSQADNALIADKVKSTLESLSSVRAQVKTISYSVNEEFEWNDFSKKSTSTGYRTVNQIQVTLNGADISSAGKVIDLAVGAGANRVSSISFGLSKEKELEVRKIALNEASAVAKVKADSIAQGLNITLGKVYSVSENSFYYTPSNYRNDSLAVGSAQDAAPTPITAGDVEVNASVAVQFELN
jgi:uncharacterized protein